MKHISKVESFTFTRVDFVDVPAYPQAGIVEMSAAFYSSKHATLEDAIKEMRGLMQFPDDSDESKYTFKNLFELQDQQLQAQAKSVEYTPKEAAALEEAIAKMSHKKRICPRLRKLTLQKLVFSFLCERTRVRRIP